MAQGPKVTQHRAKPNTLTQHRAKPNTYTRVVLAELM